MSDAETARNVAARALEGGLLLNVTGERVLRIAAPLVITDAQIDEGLAILGKAMAS
jgi:4-aminobutyrate aminotransferase-like enzyme